MIKRPVALIGLVFFMSLIAVNYISLTAAIICGIISLAGGIVAVSVKRFRKRKEYAISLFSVTAAVAMFVSFTLIFVEPVQILDGLKLPVKGRIVDEIESDNGRYTYTIKTESIGYDKAPQKIKIKVNTYSKLYADIYDKISTTVEFHAMSDSSKPFNYSSGVYITGFISGGTETKVESDGYRPPYYYAVMLRRYMHNKIYEYLPNDEASIVSSVALNITDGISDEVKTDFRDSGIYHQLAVSGQNMGIIVQFCFLLLHRLLSKRKSALITIGPIILFMAVTGFSPSVVRSGIMNIIYLLGLTLGRRADSLNSLAVAVIIMCLINPFNAINVGLQLSAYATLGLILLTGPITRFFRRAYLPKSKRARRIVKMLYSSTAQTLAATLLLIPVSILQFGYISIIGIVTNLLTLYISLIMLVLAASLLAISAVPFTGFIVYPGMVIVGLMAKYIIAVAHIMAKIPFATIPTTYRYIYLWLAGALILTALAFLLHRHKGVIKWTAIMTCVALVCGTVSYGIIYKDVTHIGVISAGSGQMVMLTRGNKSVLIGCGGDASAVYNLKDYMRRRGIREIDTVIVPELDEYFSANAAEVMSQIDANILISPPDSGGTQPLSSLSMEGIEKIELTGYDRIDIFENVYVCCNADKNYSILHAGDASVIIAGPGADTENCPADVLICGASFPQSVELYSDAAVIVGASARIEDKVFNRMKELGIAAYTTVDNDMIIEIRDNGNFKIRRGM